MSIKKIKKKNKEKSEKWTILIPKTQYFRSFWYVFLKPLESSKEQIV
jgi:hypothetical protein